MFLSAVIVDFCGHVLGPPPPEVETTTTTFAITGGSSGVWSLFTNSTENVCVPIPTLFQV